MIRQFGEMRVYYSQNESNAIRHSRYVSPFCLYTLIADIKGSAGVDAKKAGVQLPAVKAVGWTPAHSEKSKKVWHFAAVSVNIGKRTFAAVTLLWEVLYELLFYGGLVLSGF